MQNIGDARGFESLINLLEEPSHFVRRTAAEALRKLAWHPPQNALGAAYWIARRELQPCVAIGTQAIKPLIQALIGNDREVRRAAAVALQKIGIAATDDLIVVLQHRDPATYDHWDGIALAASSLGAIGDARAVEPLIAALAHTVRQVRMSAIAALGKLGDPRSVGPLMLKESKEDDTSLRSTLATALSELYGQDRLGHREKQVIMSLKGLQLRMQSNLWQLDDAFCDLIEEYGIALGTSLDGPEVINDAQRGQGSFAKTMRGIEIARGRGLGVGIICTFTRQSAERWQDVFDFFLSEGLAFSFHGAIPTLDGAAGDPFALTADGYARLFTAMFDYYLTKVRHIRVATFDELARGLTGHCTACTFAPCLGRYLSISSDGGIYPCNRFAAHSAWRLGAVQYRPTFADLAGTAAWQRLKEREASVRQDCDDCAWFSNCSGGCAYHALAAGTDRRDGYCQAYQRIFAHVTERVLNQVFSADNLTAVVAEGSSDQRGLLRRGELLQVMGGGPHPSSTVTRAREAAAAVALAVCGSPAAAFGTLEQVGLITHPQGARVSLDRLWQRLRRLPQNRNEAYVHVTYACNLTCSHCYAKGGPARSAETVTNEQAHGQPGRSVRALGAELNCEVRFRPLLPLGRGRGLSLPAGAGLPTSTEIDVLNSFHARNSCSLGQNLHFEVNGDCYPCFALLGEKHKLGNVFEQGLAPILDRNARYSQCTVDTNRQCRGCVWRYLCGGSCRMGNAGEDPNEPPLDCAALQRKSALVLSYALDVLGVDRHVWRGAGLPEGASNVSVTSPAACRRSRPVAGRRVSPSRNAGPDGTGAR